MTTPEIIVDLANSCRRFVSQALDIGLDTTIDTVPLLDHYLTILRQDKHREDITGMVVPAIGAYLGEVARGLIDDGQWSCPAGDGDVPNYINWRLVCQRVPLSFNPLGAALECAVQSDAPGWGAHFELPKEKQQLVQDYLSSIGDQVRSDDYYRLSIRLETLESVYQLLVGGTANGN